jgi:hypothetical protein
LMSAAELPTKYCSLREVFGLRRVPDRVHLQAGIARRLLSLYLLYSTGNDYVTFVEGLD